MFRRDVWVVDIPPSILIATSFEYLVDTWHLNGEDFIIRSWNNTRYRKIDRGFVTNHDSYCRLTISSAQSRTDALDRRLLVPTCITIASGFLRKIGLIWSFMSIVVQPGNKETLTFSVLEIFRPWRFFKIESPTINTSFLFADWSVGSLLTLADVRVALSVRLLEFEVWERLALGILFLPALLASLFGVGLSSQRTAYKSFITK